MNGLKEHKGASRLGYLILILIVVSAVFAGNQIFPFYYYYYELLGFMEAQADKATVFTDAEIRTTLSKKIKELEIPIDDPEELKINRFNGKIVIDLKYEEVFYLEFGDKVYDLYVFKFNPHVERSI